MNANCTFVYNIIIRMGYSVSASVFKFDQFSLFVIHFSSFTFIYSCQGRKKFLPFEWFFFRLADGVGSFPSTSNRKN